MRHLRITMIVLSLGFAVTVVFVALALASTATSRSHDDSAMALVTEKAQDAEQAEEQARSRAAEEASAPGAAFPEIVVGGSGGGPLFAALDGLTTPAYRIDVETNGFTAVFTGGDVWGAAYDVATDQVYFNSGTQLLVWPVGGTPTALGTISHTGSPFSVVGLAYYNGTLYAARNIGTENIYAIDTDTLEARQVIDLIPTTAQLDLGGLAIDQQTGKFYATNDDVDLRGLVEIGASGAVTVVAPYPPGQTDLDGLAVGGGNAYLIPDQPGSIYVFNFETMTYTAPLTNPWTTMEIFAAGTWISPTGKLTYCSQPALPVPDNVASGITDTITITESLSIVDVDMRLEVSHTWVSDLILRMEHVETGKSVTLVDRPGIPASLLGCSGDDIAAYINDEGLDGDVESTCAESTPAISGNLVGGDPPDSNLLSTFDGESLSGSWRLVASDVVTGNTGTLNEWCVIAAPETAAPDIEVEPLTLTSTQSVGKLVTWTLTISNAGTGNLQWSVSEAPDLPWLSAIPVTGTISGPGSSTVMVTFDSTSLSPGDYAGVLWVNSNDADEPQVPVSVTLTVEAVRKFLPVIARP